MGTQFYVELVNILSKAFDWKQHQKQLRAASQRDLTNVDSIHCPICGGVVIYEDNDRGRKWYCPCGKYERIEMNEQKPNHSA